MLKMLANGYPLIGSWMLIVAIDVHSLIINAINEIKKVFILIEQLVFGIYIN